MVCDFMLTDRVKPDEERIQFCKDRMSKDMGLTSQDNIKLANVGLRPLTPDTIPVMGPIKQYPNVILNTGAGLVGY